MSNPMDPKEELKQALWKDIPGVQGGVHEYAEGFEGDATQNVMKIAPGKRESHATRAAALPNSSRSHELKRWSRWGALTSTPCATDVPRRECHSNVVRGESRDEGGCPAASGERRRLRRASLKKRDLPGTFFDERLEEVSLGTLTFRRRGCLPSLGGPKNIEGKVGSRGPGGLETSSERIQRHR